MNIYSINAYLHCMKYGAPALAAWIATHNYFSCMAKGDAVTASKWSLRSIRANGKVG